MKSDPLGWFLVVLLWFIAAMIVFITSLFGPWGTLISVIWVAWCLFFITSAQILTTTGYDCVKKVKEILCRKKKKV